MDNGYTYASQKGNGAALYAPPGFEPPETLELVRDGERITFLRLSDRELDCAPVHGVKGTCGSFECHRAVLGKCQCGRHDRVTVRKATR